MWVKKNIATVQNFIYYPNRDVPHFVYCKVSLINECDLFLLIKLC